MLGGMGIKRLWISGKDLRALPHVSIGFIGEEVNARCGQDLFRQNS